VTDLPDRYHHLRIVPSDSGVTEVVFDNPERLNALDAAGHRELAYLWPDLDSDRGTRVVLLRGEGRAFSAGGDFGLIEGMIREPEVHRTTLREARDLVRNIIEFSKPIVSAIHGPAVGAGLAAALLADIPIAGRTARILDGHTTLGVAAGDHAVVIWPLLMGMAKAKYHLLTNEPLSGEEAERLGLVARVVDDDEVLDAARAIARRLARGSPEALSWTKHTLNHWLRAAYPAFDASVAYEFLGFLGPDAAEGLQAIREKRPPNFE
jgi:enoyl-CoA hydratase